MIATADQRLAAWVRDVLGPVSVSFEPPGAPHPGDGLGDGVSVYLLELIDQPPARDPRQQPPLQVGLRYLITTFGPDVATAHDRLGRLVFAALDNTEFEAAVRPLDAAVWTALGAVPQPSFQLEVPLRVERTAPAAKRVQLPLVLEHAPMASLRGRVLGPGDLPLPMARVELTSLGFVSHTDVDGQFAFGAIPAEPRRRHIRVRAKGKELVLQTDQGIGDDDPLVIRFPSMED